jgi:hypothetical protein
MIITFEQNIFEKLPFEQSHIRAIDFRAADFEQLHSSNLPRFHLTHVLRSLYLSVYICQRKNNTYAKLTAFRGRIGYSLIQLMHWNI